MLAKQGTAFSPSMVPSFWCGGWGAGAMTGAKPFAEAFARKRGKHGGGWKGEAYSARVWRQAILMLCGMLMLGGVVVVVVMLRVVRALVSPTEEAPYAAHGGESRKVRLAVSPPSMSGAGAMR